MRITSQFKALGGTFLLLLILSVPCFAAPSFTTWDNSKDNTTYYPDLTILESVTFNITADEAITQYHWYKDGTSISNNYDNYSTAFSTPYHHNISVFATSASGNTTMLSWYPIVSREVATTTPEDVNESGYTDLLSSVEVEDFEAFVGASIFPFTNLMGSVFYLIVFGIYFLMVWIRQEDLSIVMVTGFAIGSIILGYMVESFAQTLVLMLVIAVTSVMYSLFKERR
jgi:hypothetical protein